MPRRWLVTLSLLAAAAAQSLGQEPPIEPRHQDLIAAGPLISTDRGEVVWSPAGDQIAYTEWTHISTEETRRDIAVLDLVDLSWHQVTTEYAGAYPAWSPDGTQLAYVELDPQRRGSGDIVISRLDGTPPQRVTRGGGFMDPVWVPGPPPRFVAVRSLPGHEAGDMQLCLIDPQAPWDEAVSVVASWTAVEEGIPTDVVVSPSGRRAFVYGKFKVMVDGQPRKEPRVALIDLWNEATGWVSQAPDAEIVELPTEVQWIDHLNWSPDETRLLMTMGLVSPPSAREIWMFTVEDRSFRRIRGASGEGAYEYARWVDGGRALLGLFDPAPNPAEPQPPGIRLIPLGQGDETVLEPAWSQPLLVDLTLEMTPDPSGRIVAVSSGGEIRFFELGTREEAAVTRSKRNLRLLGMALLDWARENQWKGGPDDRLRPRLPDPTDQAFQEAHPGIDTRREDCWVDLIEPRLIDRMGRRAFEDLLIAPGDDPDGRTSYVLPVESYGAMVGLGAMESDTVVLRERQGLHPDGYHVYRLGMEVEWIPTQPAQ
jgi:hypothetical protein